jgi:hypothetical protein
MLARRASRRVVGLGQHSAGLQRAYSSLSQYGVVQQLWAGTATVPSDATARRHTADRVQ